MILYQATIILVWIWITDMASSHTQELTLLFIFCPFPTSPSIILSSSPSPSLSSLYCSPCLPSFLSPLSLSLPPSLSPVASSSSDHSLHIQWRGERLVSGSSGAVECICTQLQGVGREWGIWGKGGRVWSGRCKVAIILLVHNSVAYC